MVETANLHVSSTKDFQEDVRNGLDLVLGKHSCVHLKLQSSLREGRRGGEGRRGEGREVQRDKDDSQEEVDSLWHITQ